MKRFYFFALVAAMFAACATDATEDVAIGVPETLRVSFEDEDSRIQLANGKTVWTKGDQVSVFYRSNANQKWQYKGETGERVGELQQVDAGSATREMDRVVVVYPYNESYYINPSTCNVQASLPAVQTYLADSYGLNGNIMVSHGEYNNISLKSVCGWLKLQLTGNGEKVQTITLKGNNGEQVAGEIYINSADATAILSSDAGDADDSELGGAGGNLLFENTILNEVTLNCGDGVTLSAEPTAFYIGLPPQEFSKGLTVEIKDSNSLKMIKSTDKAITIERNHIQPMAAFEYEGYVPQSWKEIRYTATKKAIPYKTNVFGANVVSNEWNSTTREGIITFDGKVTSIGYYAFQNCTSLTSITIPDSVTSIRGSAFEGCSSLTSVTIPDSVTELGYRAFYSCTSLTSVTIPDSVTSIGDRAFCGCTSLKEVYYNGDLSAWCKININGYYGNPMCNWAKLYLNGVELTEATIPSNVTKIKDFTFYGCTSLTSVTIPDSVTSIEEHAFYNCTSLTSVTIGDSVTSIGEWAFYICTSLTSVTIGDSVTEIGECAFNGCTSLTSVTIPDSVTEIGEGTFGRCTSLTSVTIPNSVTSIGNAAFRGCTSLSAFYGKFASVDNRCLVVNGVLNSFALAGLTEYTIPNSVTSIGGSAFDGCTSLTSVTIPDSVTSIGQRAFSGCSSLTSVTIPDSVTEIGPQAISYCTSLTSVTIGKRVTSIGYYAFEYCTSLKEVYCKPTTPPSGGSDMFYNNASGRKIYVPRASVDAYKAATGWSYYKSSIEPYDF